MTDIEKNQRQKSNQASKIIDTDPASLGIVRYPDPRLRHVCEPLEKVDDSVRAVVERMFELMFEFRGVGLAAPQVGLTARLFVASPTFDPEDRRVYINPEIIASDGTQDGDEGCLSFPDVSCRIRRKTIVTIRAMDLDGEIFEETGEELTARIFQHENDHLEARLLIDRMGTVAKLANRRALKELEQAFTP